MTDGIHGIRVRRPLALRVLLVEDNLDDAWLVQVLLSRAETPVAFEVAHAGRLENGVRLIEETEFDVVLLDLSLPDASGLEAVGRIRGIAAHLPVVVLSGLSDEETAVQAIQGEAEDYLVKGQGDGALISRSIRYAIERKKAEEHLVYVSNYDSLTQLANRVLFQDRLGRLWRGPTAMEASWPCCSWTSIASRRSMTLWAPVSGTSSLRPSPTA